MLFTETEISRVTLFDFRDLFYIYPIRDTNALHSVAHALYLPLLSII
jgi:hypothetical protein